MSQQGTNQFKYNGEKYTFTVTFDHSDLKKPITLEQQQILKFQYVNELNKLYMTAELDCVDTGGQIDRFLDKMHVLCYVILVAHKQKNDEAFTVEKIDDDKAFQHVFIVDNIGITDRNNSQITYKIKLASINKIRCSANIAYSNYAIDNDEEKSVFNILKACLIQAGLNIDAESFEGITTPVKLDYITNGNDTAETILKFLLNRLYYFSTKDLSFKAIAYNQNYDQYTLFDIVYATRKGLSTILLSMFNKSQNEAMTAQEPAQLATVAKFPYSSAITNIYSRDFQDYSFNTNEFVDKSIATKTLLQYYNTRPENSDYINKFRWPLHKTMASTIAASPKLRTILEGFNLDLLDQEPATYTTGDPSVMYSRRGTYWNNNFQIYDQLYKTLTEDNSLVVNCPGNLIRCPGNVVAIGIDRDKEKMINDSRSQLEEMMNMYKGLESNWIISKVVNIVEPSKSRYRQNLVLFRNYVTTALDSEVKA